MSTKLSLWVYTLAVAAVALAAYPTLVRDYGPFTSRELGGGLILLLAAPAAELLVVHIHFRKNAHSFSLLELPLIAGVMTASPLMVVAAYAIGGGAVLLIHRRQPPLKLIFNTATFLLTATVAVWLFETVPHSASVTSASTWAVAFASALSASFIGTVLVFGIISMAERRLVLGNLRSALAFGLATASGGASLGIACAILATISLPAVVFVTAPLAAVFVANRAYEAERQRRENLQLVYDTSRTLTDEPESEDALFGALLRCYESLPSDFAAIYLPHGAQGGVIVLRVDEAGQHRRVEPAESITPLLELAAAHGRAWLMSPETDSDTQPGGSAPVSRDRATLSVATGAKELVEALVAPLSSGAESVGVVVVGSYGNSLRHFGHNELELFETVCNSIASHTRLTRQANQDALTNLPNRRRLLQRLEMLYEGRLAAANVATLLIDLDDFKGINDTFGHAVGDAVLAEVARRLTNSVPDRWMVARLGGDEFAILGEMAGPDEWTFIAEAVLTAFREPILTSSQSFAVRLSIGTALGADADSPATLLRNADTALYEAKRLGRGQMQAYTESMHARVARRYNVAEALREALDGDETTVVIQPVVRLEDGVIVGGEALSRWDSPELGRIGPDEFIVVAEQHGLSAPLAARVIAKVVSALSDWPGALSVSLNVSPGDLADSSIVTALLDGARAVHPHVLGVEVTERLLLSDPAILAVLQELREGGLHVYIDDFGTGYSSLAYLKDVPADYLKVPREFVRDIAVGSRTLAVVDAIVAVGRALGLQVVAEGVETESQQRLLGLLGTEYAQGYLFSKPLSLDQFRDLVAASEADRAA